MASQRQIDANRQNAQKSTGPKTPEGKAAVSQNALQHPLTAEDEDEFNATRQSFEDELKPVGPLQTLLVEQIVMAAWRLARIRTLESGLFQLSLMDDTKDIDEARTERSFYRALHELQRLQKEMAKQSQILPEPEHQQDFTPQSDNHQITQSPIPPIPGPPIVYNGINHESSRLRIT